MQASESQIDDFSKPSAQCDEKLRVIAWNIDTLQAGLYIWFGKVRIRLGGNVPDDQPYKYPGMIHSQAGIALVLPNYHIFSTYQDSFDPK